MLRRLATTAFLLGLSLARPASAAGLPTKEEALALAFPNATTQRRESFLTPEQVVKVKALAGTEPSTRFIVAYEAKAGGAVVGVAFFDSHIVRTQQETAMVAISPSGKVVRIEVVDFHEPVDYRAPAAWVRQFDGKSLGPDLTLKGEIRPLSGASLTANALTEAARRALALWQVLYGARP
jgi:hypothetical protein